MSAWLRKVDLYDLFHENDDIPFTEIRDRVVERLTGIVPEDLVADLGYTDDEDEFNDVLDDIFDWADIARVWINVMFPQAARSG